jgi:hypothetical protein
MFLGVILLLFTTRREGCRYPVLTYVEHPVFIRTSSVSNIYVDSVRDKILSTTHYTENKIEQHEPNKEDIYHHLIECNLFSS